MKTIEVSSIILCEDEIHCIIETNEKLIIGDYISFEDKEDIDNDFPFTGMVREIISENTYKIEVE